MKSHLGASHLTFEGGDFWSATIFSRNLPGKIFFPSYFSAAFFVLKSGQSKFLQKCIRIYRNSPDMALQSLKI